MHGITPAGPWTAVRVPHPRAHECGTGGPLIPAAIAGRSVDLVLAMCGGRGLERRWHIRQRLPGDQDAFGVRAAADIAKALKNDG